MVSEGRKMYDVRAYNLTCAQCGKPIEELPFLPLSSSRPIYCRECNEKRPPTKKKDFKRKTKGRRR